MDWAFSRRTNVKVSPGPTFTRALSLVGWNMKSKLYKALSKTDAVIRLYPWTLLHSLSPWSHICQLSDEWFKSNQHSRFLSSLEVNHFQSSTGQTSYPQLVKNKGPKATWKATWQRKGLFHSQVHITFHCQNQKGQELMRDRKLEAGTAEAMGGGGCY